jgi:hypothetical protein
VNRMLDMAEDQSFLFPVMIDETPEMTARVPDRFRERQWPRLPGGLALFNRAVEAPHQRSQ